MKAFALLAASAVSASLLAAPALGSVMVAGNSVGHGCYASAKVKNGSAQALRVCDDALSSGLLSYRDEVATYVNRGIVKLHGGSFDSAVADFDRAIEMDPKQPESYLNKGSTYLRKGAPPEQAIALFNESLQRGTARPELAYFSRAIAHEVAGDMKAAYLDYRRAQDAAPRWERPGQELSRFQVRRAGQM